MTPLFSIIIPTFNASKTVDKALDSIVSQTFKNVEVLIQDGKSTDQTVGIAETYKEKITQLHITSESDTGIYDGMNKALKRASGEYVYFMGSDDTLYTPDVLKEIGYELLENPVDVIHGDVFSSRFNGRYDGPFTHEKIVRQNICHQAMFMRRSVFDLIGTFKLEYKAQADWHHNISWMLHKNVSRMYIDLIIANYADGGFSSVNNDLRFRMDKGWFVLKKGLRRLPGKVLRDVLADSLVFSKQQQNTGMILRYKIMITLVKVGRKLKLLK
jgi:glycosyltransferase involved in cell wall biosynthesis